MNETTHHRETLDQLAEEFAERYRRGERPTVEEYAAAHPELASEIRDLFPTLAMMEELAPSEHSEPGVSAPGGRSILVKPLDRIGDFRILREIGRGGMGVVYEAEQESLGRHVALKVLPLHSASDPKLLARFRRESRAAGQLHHTNIVPVFEVGEYGDIAWYAMQFIPGQALDEVVRELQRLRAGKTGDPVQPSPLTQSLIQDSMARGPELNRTEAYRPEVRETACAIADSTPMPQSSRSAVEVVELDFRLCCRNVARIGLQASEALAYAHARGVIHRDIKPSNLLLDTAGIVWVSDFGLAKTQDHALTETGDIVGTVRYMAPERFRGECDARSDVYSLGVTLYELLTLIPAFNDSDRLKLIESIGKSEPAKPRAIEPQIPRDVETIVLKAIEKDPRRRYQSAEAMAADLRRYLNDEPIQARRVGVIERGWRWVRRNPWVTGLASAIAVITAIGFAVTLSQMRAVREQRDELRGTLYASEMNLVQSAYEADNVARALDILERQRPNSGAPDLRAWEWHYWRRQCVGEDRSVSIAQAIKSFSLARAVFSPDGALLAVTDLASPQLVGNQEFQQHELQIIETKTGRPLFSKTATVFSRNVPQIQSAAFSPDGKRVAASYVANGDEARVDATMPEKATHRVTIYDSHLGNEQLNIEVPGHLSGLAFTADGKCIVGWVRSSDFVSTLKRWDSESGREVGYNKLAANILGTPIVSPDGKTIALVPEPVFPPPRRDDPSKPHGIQAIDLSTSREFWIEDSNNSWHAASFSPDGRLLAACSWDGRQIVVFDVRANRVQVKLNLQSSANESSAAIRFDRLAFNSDGSRLLIASRSHPTAQVWDLRSSRPIRLLRGHSFGIEAIGLESTTGGFLTVGIDRAIRRWPAPTTNEWAKPGSFESVSPDGRIVAIRKYSIDGSSSLSIAKLGVKPEMMQLNLTNNGGPKSGRIDRRRNEFPIFAADGNQLVVAHDNAETGQTELQVVDVQTGRITRTLPLGEHVGQLYLAGGRDGRRVAAFSLKTHFGPAPDPHDAPRHYVWDLETGAMVCCVSPTVGEAPNNHFSFALSWDGTMMVASVSVNSKPSVRIWKVDSGQVLCDIPTVSEPTALSFGPSGKGLLVMTGAIGGGQPSVGTAYDTATGRVLTSVRGMFGNARHAAFSPDGKRLAIASVIPETNSCEVKIWDLTSERELATFKTPGDGPRSLHFTLDGHKLIILGASTGVHIWDGTPLPDPSPPETNSPSRR